MLSISSWALASGARSPRPAAGSPEPRDWSKRQATASRPAICSFRWPSAPSTSGDPDEALAALRTSRRHRRAGSRNRELSALSRLGQGQCLIGIGETERGVALLDEAMVAVTAGEAIADRSRGSCTAPSIEAFQRDLRPPPRAGVDGGTDALVRCRSPTSSRSAAAASSTARSSCSSTAQWRRGDRRGRAVLRTGCRGHRPSPRSGRRSTSRPSCTACAGTTRRRRRPIARPASGVVARNPGWRCFALPRDDADGGRGDDPAGPR